MKTLIVYLGLAAAGYAAAIPFRKKKEYFGWIGPVLAWVVRILVFLMGLRIGSNEEVVENLAAIGVQSLLIAVVSLAFTVAAVHAARRAAGFNRFGRRCTEAGQKEEKQPAHKKADAGEKTPILSRSNLFMLASVAAGFACGYLAVLKLQLTDYETLYGLSGLFVSTGLYVMVFLVGMDMGFDSNTFRALQGSGLFMLVIPVVTAVATLAAVLLCSLFMPLTLQEAAAVACSYCWYSLAPNIIMEAGFAVAGAYSFLTNFLRVLLSLITIPLVAARVGYLETVGMPCGASMDVCIGTIQISTSRETALYAFVSGVFFMVIIPVLVPLIVGL